MLENFGDSYFDLDHVVNIHVKNPDNGIFYIRLKSGDEIVPHQISYSEFRKRFNTFLESKKYTPSEQITTEVEE